MKNRRASWSSGQVVDKGHLGPKVRGLGQVETPTKPIRTRLEDRIGQQIDPYANLFGRDF